MKALAYHTMLLTQRWPTTETEELALTAVDSEVSTEEELRATLVDSEATTEVELMVSAVDFDVTAEEELRSAVVDLEATTEVTMTAVYLEEELSCGWLGDNWGGCGAVGDWLIQ